MENLNEGKKKKGGMAYEAALREIDAQSAVVALEAKIGKLKEMAMSKKDRMKMVQEDENLSELIDKKAMNEMMKEIKQIEKMQEKLEKLYEKKNGKKPVEVVDEEMDKLPKSIADKEKFEIERDARKLEEDGLDETYGSTTYEEDDSVSEGGYDSTYEEDDTVNEEFLRMQKLSGIISEEEYKRELNELFGFGKKKKMVWYLLNKAPRKDNAYTSNFMRQLKGPKDGSDKKGADAALKKHVGATGESAIAVLAKPGFSGFEGDKSWDSISKMDGVEDVLVQTN